jgi:hypothetical protein
VSERISSPVPERRPPPGSLGLRLANNPTRSVVLASSAPRERLEEWLAALVPRCTGSGIELVVARSTAKEEFRDLVKSHPRVLFMPGPDGCTPRQLRGYGLAAADGDIVMITEDSRPPDLAWIDAATAAVAPGPPE